MTVLVICDNRLRLSLWGDGAFPKELVEELRLRNTHRNPAYYKAKAMRGKYAKTDEPESYLLCRDEGARGLSIPRGRMDVLRELFDEHGLDYEVEDRRSAGNANKTGSYEDGWNLAPGVAFPEYRKVLWTHQTGIKEAIEKFEQILIRSPTGSGKTSALIASIAALGVPACVVMWDSGLLEQWQERIEEELGIAPRDQGLIRGPTCRLRGITLAMQQTMNQWTAEKWAAIEGVFGLVACDEVQRYAASTFIKTIDRFDCKYRVGVSADERRKDGKQFLIYSQFGQVRHEVSKKELVDKRIIHEVEVYVVPTAFRADWYAEKREDEEKQIEGQDFNTLLAEMQGDEERNKLAAHLITQCVRSGLPTLSFTHRVEHAKLIALMATKRGLRSGLALGGEDYAEEFSATIAGLRAGTLDVGCGTFGKLGVGHDIPTVAAGIAVTPVHNNRPFLGQVKGRICRTSKGKENARVIVLWDVHVFGDGPLHNLRRWNEVCRVWCAWSKRWKPADEYLREAQHGRGIGAEAEGTTADLFGSAQQSATRRAPPSSPRLENDSAEYAGSELRVTWGKEHYRPMKFQGFDVGPFEIVVTVREGETPLEARRRASAQLEAMAQQELKEKLPRFLARCQEAERLSPRPTF